MILFMTDPNTQNRQSFRAASFHPRSLTPFAAKVIDSALCNLNGAASPSWRPLVRGCCYLSAWSPRQ